MGTSIMASPISPGSSPRASFEAQRGRRLAAFALAIGLPERRRARRRLAEHRPCARRAAELLPAAAELQEPACRLTLGEPHRLLHLGARRRRVAGRHERQPLVEQTLRHRARLRVGRPCRGSRRASQRGAARASNDAKAKQPRHDALAGAPRGGGGPSRRSRLAI